MIESDHTVPHLRRRKYLVNHPVSPEKMAFHLWPMVSGFFADNQCQPIWRDDDSAEGRFRDPAGLSIDCFEKTYPKLDIVG